MRRLLAALALSPIFVLALAATSQEEPVVSSGDDQVERGRYLVEKVAMCGQCHSPRDDRGNLLPGQWLQGASVPVSKPEGYTEKWAYRAPRIAGLPQHTDEEFLVLMTTGVNRDGKTLMPPMPPYRMGEEDVHAIAAYLRSLN